MHGLSWSGRAGTGKCIAWDVPHAKLLMEQIAVTRKFIQRIASDGEASTSRLTQPDSVQRYSEEISLQLSNLPNFLSELADQNLLQHGTRNLSKSEVSSLLFGLSEVERFVQRVKRTILIFPDLAAVQEDGMDIS